MAHAKITLNGRTLLNDPLDTWHEKPPDTLREYLKPGTSPNPWIKPAMVALADAAMLNQPIHIDVTTQADGWNIAVRNHP